MRCFGGALGICGPPAPDPAEAANFGDQPNPQIRRKSPSLQKRPSSPIPWASPSGPPRWKVGARAESGGARIGEAGWVLVGGARCEPVDRAPAMHSLDPNAGPTQSHRGFHVNHQVKSLGDPSTLVLALAHVVQSAKPRGPILCGMGSPSRRKLCRLPGYPQRHPHFHRALKERPSSLGLRPPLSRPVPGQTSSTPGPERPGPMLPGLARPPSSRKLIVSRPAFPARYGS